MGVHYEGSDGLAMLVGAGRINFLHDAFRAEIHGCLCSSCCND